MKTCMHGLTKQTIKLNKSTQLWTLFEKNSRKIIRKYVVDVCDAVSY